MRTFFRLCLDLDRAGQPLGASYEVHDDQEVRTFGTVLVGPFDSREDALEACMAAVIERFGLELAFRF